MINNLLVVAAPSSGGKTVFVNALISNNFSELNIHFDVENFKLWQRTPSSKLAERIDWHGNLIIEFTTQRFNSGHIIHIEMDRLVKQAKNVFFIILWTDPQRLAHQRLLRMCRGEHPRVYRLINKLFEYLPTNQRNKITFKIADKLLYSSKRDYYLGSTAQRFNDYYTDFYSKPAKIVDLQQAWLAYCDAHAASARHVLIVENYNELRILTRNAWENIAKTVLL